MRMFGRMLFVGLSTNDKQVIQKLIKKWYVGGLILYSRNYKTYEEMLELINYIHKTAQEAGYIILIGIDQEGYRVNRLPKEINNLKSPYAFHKNLDDIKKHGEILASILAKSHIHVNLAPVLDIKRFKNEHPIGDRCFGSDDKTVTRNTLAYIQEFKDKKVVCAVKHFPGHGATKINSHLIVPIIWNVKKLWQEDLIPFQKAIEQGIDMLMIGHFIIPKFSFWPTSINSGVVKLLREELHYQNIIMTDDLLMGPFKLVNKAFLIKSAINHGINMITIKYYEGLFGDLQKLEKQKNKLKETNINYSISLVDRLINKYQIDNSLVNNTLDISKINAEITNLNKHAK